VVPEDQARVLAELGAHLSGNTEPFASEFRVRKKDGSVRWHLARGGAVRDAAGRPIRFAGTSIDVTHLKEAEAEGQRVVAQMWRSIGLSGVGIWGYELTADADLAKAKPTFDRDGVLSSLGYDVNEVGPSIVDRLGAVVHPEDQPRMGELL